MPGRTVRLEGERVLLRAFGADEIEAIVAGRAGGDELAQPEGPPNEKHAAGIVQRSGRFVRGCLDLAIEAEGRLIGDIQARRGRRMFPPGVYEVGIDIYAESDRGKGYGSESVRLLTGWLFERERAGRVQAGTATVNAAMRKTLERVGFTFEGVLRAFLPSGRSRADTALYAMTRDDWSNRGSETRRRVV